MVGRKGQGAIEYLLILAAVLIVVAGAVYYVTRTGGFPAMTMTATISGDNVVLEVKGPSGTIKAGDWQYRAKTSTGTVPEAWIDGTQELSEGTSVVLTGLSTYVQQGQLKAGDLVQIRHKPSGHVYDVQIVG